MPGAGHIPDDLAAGVRAGKEPGCAGIRGESDADRWTQVRFEDLRAHYVG